MYRSDLIRQKMNKNGWSVQTLAQEAELSRPTVYALLEGKRVTLETLQSVSRVLSIPLSKLIVEAEAA